MAGYAEHVAKAVSEVGYDSTAWEFICLDICTKHISCQIIFHVLCSRQINFRLPCCRFFCWYGWHYAIISSDTLFMGYRWSAFRMCISVRCWAFSVSRGSRGSTLGNAHRVYASTSPVTHRWTKFFVIFTIHALFMHLVASVSVSVLFVSNFSKSWPINFIFRMCRSSSYIKVVGQSQGYGAKGHTSAGSAPSIERQSCYSTHVGVRSIVINPSVCLSVCLCESVCVCLSASISLELLYRSAQNFVSISPVAMAQSSWRGCATLCTSGLWMT